MRKLHILMFLFVSFAMILAACAPAEEAGGEGTPGFETPGLTEEPGFEVTPGLTETAVMTEEPTLMATTPAMTEEPSPTTVMATATPVVGAATATQVVGAETGTPTTAAPGGLETNASMVSQLVGLGVRNQESERLGEINELIIDREACQVTYLVIGAGGVLGIGEKLVLVPWNAFTFDVAAEEIDQIVLLNVDQQVLAEAPSFDPEQLPDVRTADWDSDLRAYWQDHVDVLPVTGEAGQPAAPARIADVGDIAVRDAAGEEIGVIQEIILDPETGQITHVVLAPGGALADLGDRVIPVPCEAFTVNLDEEGEEVVLILDMDMATLEAAPSFATMDEFPDTRELGWDAEIEQYWADLIGEEAGAGTPTVQPGVTGTPTGLPVTTVTPTP